MRVAFFTPLAPVPSGTADYATELIPHLQERAEIDVFVDPVHQRRLPEDLGQDLRVLPYQEFESLRRSRQYDVTLYAIANNPFHIYAYRMALRFPGVVILHDYNLHHLLAQVTIVNNDWEEYFRLVEEEGGPKALEHARLVRRGLTGPNYDKIMLNRRLLRHSLGAVVHSHYVASLLRKAGYDAPIRRIHHGVRQVDVSPGKVSDLRRRLNLPSRELLFASFGFIRPYKRISSCLKALAQVQSDLPSFRYLLVGEEHPDYPVREEIRQMGLQGKVILTGKVSLKQFWDYILASDVCLTLRYPTAGETSGSLLRELAAGKAVIVSNIGAFAEWPDDCCAKADVNGCEVAQLDAYLKLFAGQAAIREQVGSNAQTYVRTQCSWEQAASAYCEFLAQFAEGSRPGTSVGQRPARPLRFNSQEIEAFILGFFQDRPEAQNYARLHMPRFLETFAWVPRGDSQARLLEMGCYLQMTPILAKYYGYGEVRGSYVGPAGKTDSREIVHATTGERYQFEIDLFDAEKDTFPYPDGEFRTVLCCELIEHLANDPAHMLVEINRILEPNGFLLLTTPNTASWKSLMAILRGGHPGLFATFLREPGDGGGRHAREYTPNEIRLLLGRSGFQVIRLETQDFYGPSPVDTNLRTILLAAGYQEAWGGDTVLALAKKIGAPKQRYPAEFYQ